MRKYLFVAAFLSIGSQSAWAQERVLDGALGGIAGAVVAGPIGLVAGAITGVTAGPAISSSWGLSGSRRHAYHRRRRHHVSR
ncbi:hypothetical protein FM996_18420 [Methylosinus sporium]|uniref:Glycine zipper domain-containing protein n=1 Tax=Methylosinus sporium TaxID=428 RepID=A0A549SFU7_METSR|nr:MULTISPECIES: hypothetical protein [Methylosinus]TRL28505.1 hypothetical protein FM996_18420 [Methylosinus sporium]